MEEHLNSLVEIPLDDITPSPTQPRTRMEPPALDELAASIRRQGILQPITVRPHPAETPPTTYELVAGERRWRAARLAGLATITARVRVLTDREVLEVQLVENAQRADVHPLDEADGYRRLHTEHGVSVDEIAARTGHPVGRIRQRLTLAALGTDGREALLAGKILLTVALKIARLGAGDQAAAVEHLTKPAAHGGGARWTEEDAGAWIKGRYYLRLGTAPFDATDARLLQGVPPCAACPSNTLSQGHLFEDLGDAHCLDPDCFRRKTAAQWNRQTRDLAEAGRVVATLEESDAALVGGSPAKGYVRADDKPEEFGGKKTWRALLAKASPTVVLVRNPATQEIVEMIRPSDLKAAVASVGLTKKTRAPHEPDPVPASAVHLSDAAKARELAVFNARLEAVAIGAQEKHFENERALWQFIARAVSYGAGPDAFNAMTSRRRITAATDLRARHIAFDEEVTALTARACRGLVLELLTASELLAGGADLDDAQGALLIAEHLGLDLRAVKRVTLDALDAPAKPKGKREEKAPEPAAEDTETTRINGLAVGDLVTLDGIDVEVMGVDTEGWTWRTVDENPRDRDEGECLWSEVDRTVGHAWCTRHARVDETTAPQREAAAFAAAQKRTAKPKAARLTPEPEADALAVHGEFTIVWKSDPANRWSVLWTDKDQRGNTRVSAWAMAASCHRVREYNRGGRCTRDSLDEAAAKAGAK